MGQVVPRRGFEPRSARSKHAVLPLDERGMARVTGLEPAITVLETAALAAKLHRHYDSLVWMEGLEPPISCSQGRRFTN